jgi:hypothetical protein
LAALSLRKEPLVSTEQEGERLWGREKSLAPAENGTPVLLLASLKPAHYTDCAVTEKIKCRIDVRIVITVLFMQLT